MITNDVKNVEMLPSLYSLFLNPAGRVLYDLILYKICDTEYLVEYDATGIEYVHKHLTMYRLRKNVQIEPSSDMSVWVIYKQNNTGSTDENFDLEDIYNHLNKISDIVKYQLGIGEGILDHPPGNCLPFETNVDLLNGVSFTKGCYIGQEMTAKSNFVFSVRKRLMPVILVEMNSYPIFLPECNILNDKQKKMGRLRSRLGQHGLGLLKFEDCMKSNFLQLQGYDIKLKAIWPNWWPKSLSSNKNEHIFSL
ncbi:putative transferase CAF17, mitochondrial [Nephila pilipes]|uniref:Putative transferase CAF17, mitochondrial n=1 Tax=Nephila pilipes TaxID=299642 RepID=A0A8X6T650_NEPPI|nr:putative transferase CAF17, mitochondrial [Nephila pilipes]